MEKSYKKRIEKINDLLVDKHLRLKNPAPLFDTWFYIEYGKENPEFRTDVFLVSEKDYQKIKEKSHRPLEEKYLTGVRYKGVDFIFDYDGITYNDIKSTSVSEMNIMHINKEKMFEILVKGVDKSAAKAHLNQLCFFLLNNFI